MHSNHTTSSLQLDRIGRKILGDDYIGAFPADVFVNDIEPIMNGGQTAIVNTENSNQGGQHWLSAVKLNDGKLLMHDSYGSDIKKYNKLFRKLNFIQGHIPHQFGLQDNCGQQALTSLEVFEKEGPLGYIHS